MSKQEKVIERQIEKAVEQFCDNYCKYPEQWSGKTDELKESEICNKCPLAKIIVLSAIYGMV